MNLLIIQTSDAFFLYKAETDECENSTLEIEFSPQAGTLSAGEAGGDERNSEMRLYNAP